MIAFRRLAAVLLMLESGTALATEEPRHTVLRTGDTFEVRRYEPYLVAETLVTGSAEDARNQGFRLLAGYIFGKNKGAREIAMTAPVAQTPTRIAMTEAGLRWRGEPAWAGYDPPWKPWFLRRNEIWLEVD
jgi:hypothetical protein